MYPRGPANGIRRPPTGPLPAHGLQDRTLERARTQNSRGHRPHCGSRSIRSCVLHGAADPFLISAGQLTITVSSRRLVAAGWRAPGNAGSRASKKGVRRYVARFALLQRSVKRPKRGSAAKYQFSDAATAPIRKSLPSSQLRTIAHSIIAAIAFGPVGVCCEIL